MTLDEITALMQRGLDARPLDKSLKFDCGAEGVVTLANGVVTMQDIATDCTIRISKSNLENVVSGKMNPMTGVALGKIKVSGDISVALKLGELLKRR